MATVLTFDVTLFREQFPAFASDTTYPDAQLQMYWDMATCYISDVNYGYLRDDCRQLAINQKTAHLQFLASQVAVKGTTTGLINSTTIDKISVSLTAPPFGTSQFKWWLNQSPYGQMLLALLSQKAVGGLYVGGSPERAAFRKVGGVFW